MDYLEENIPKMGGAGSLVSVTVTRRISVNVSVDHTGDIVTSRMTLVTHTSTISFHCCCFLISQYYAPSSSAMFCLSDDSHVFTNDSRLHRILVDEYRLTVLPR